MHMAPLTAPTVHRIDWINPISASPAKGTKGSDMAQVMCKAACSCMLHCLPLLPTTKSVLLQTQHDWTAKHPQGQCVIIDQARAGARVGLHAVAADEHTVLGVELPPLVLVHHRLRPHALQPAAPKV